MMERLPRRHREQWELELIRQRMLKTRTRRVIDGRHAGGRVAYGYRLALEPIEGLLVINVAEAAVVRKIFMLRAQGQSYRQIADTLNKDGVASPSSKAWGESSVRIIATNPIYAGIQRRRTADGHYVQGVCPSIISTAELLAAMLPTPPVRPGRRRQIVETESVVAG